MTTTYYANVNPELLRWLPLASRGVLELGCGEGALAAAYRRRNPAVRYTAIESHGPSRRWRAAGWTGWWRPTFRR